MRGRLQYFDVLKGIAIFLVVMGHIITMCIREIDRTPLFKLIGEIHMPLFFFISGWFTFKILPDGNIKKPALLKRARQLLVPMVVVSTLWIFFFPHSGLKSPIDSSFSGLWCNIWKNGYWFTLTLFEIVAVYYSIVTLLNRKDNLRNYLTVSFISWVILLGCYFLLMTTTVNDVLGLELLVTFWPVFMTGVLAARFKDKFFETINSGMSMTCFLIGGGLILYYICWWWEFPGVKLFSGNEINLIIARPLFHICLAFVAISLFKPAVENAVLKERLPLWVRFWSFLGVNSLAIYLLHYFFLFPMPFLREFLLDVNLSFIPVLVISGVCALANIGVVLGFTRLISISPLLTFLLTGKIADKK